MTTAEKTEKITIIPEKEIQRLVRENKELGQANLPLVEQLNELINRKPTFEQRPYLTMTLGDIFRLGRALKPRHLVGALWKRVFSQQEATHPQVGEVCHQGALAVGFGQWDFNNGRRSYWPPGAPNPSVTSPCRHANRGPLSHITQHLADMHPPRSADPISHEQVAEFYDRVAPAPITTRWRYDPEAFNGTGTE